MADSVYTVIELVGTSSAGFEQAVAAAAAAGPQPLPDLRIAKGAVTSEEGRAGAYGPKVNGSSKCAGGGWAGVAVMPRCFAAPRGWGTPRGGPGHTEMGAVEGIAPPVRFEPCVQFRHGDDSA